MKVRFFSILLILSVFLAPVHVLGKISGYLSFEYIKGQDQSDQANGSFRNSQLGLIFSDEIAPRIDYVAEIRFKEESRIELEQAWVGFNLSNSLNFKLGLYIVPFGKYNQANRPHQTMLINAPLIVEEMFPPSWRDIGVQLEGRTGNIYYSAYWGNGLLESENLEGGQQFRDNNLNKAKGARLGAVVSKSLEVALSYYRGKYDEGNERDLILQGIDLIWSSEGLQIISEYLKGTLKNPENFSEGNVEGYYVQASFESGTLRPVVSYQRLKYEDPYHGQGFDSPVPGAGISEEKKRWTLGLVYFASENVFLKFEYDFNREKDPEIKDNSYSFQVCLSF
jgi:phosphate-selective porin